MLNVMKNLLGRVRLETVQPPPPEALRPKPRPMVGLYALLSEEQKKRALNFKGSETFGPDEFRGRTGA